MKPCKVNLAKIWLFLTIEAVNKDKKQKKILQTIMFIIFWEFLMVEQIFLSWQVKQNVIISNKLWNNLRLSILGNLEISGKSQNLIELLPSA